MLGNEQRVILLANFTDRSKDCFYQGGCVRASGAQFLMSEWSSLARGAPTEACGRARLGQAGRLAGKKCVYSCEGCFTEKRGQFGRKSKVMKRGKYIL